MNLYVDLDLLQLRASGTDSRRVDTINAKRGDALPLTVRFYQGGIQVRLDATTTIRFAIKENGKFDDDPLVLESSFTASTVTSPDSDPHYTATPSLNTTELNALFLINADSSDDPASIDLMGELTWEATGDTGPTTIRTFTVAMANDVYRGDENTPTSLPTPEDWLNDELEDRGLQPIRTGTDHFFPASITLSGTVVLDGSTVVWEPLPITAMAAGATTPSYAVTTAAGIQLSLGWALNTWTLEVNDGGGNIKIFNLDSAKTDPNGIILAGTTENVTVSATNGIHAPVTGDRAFNTVSGNKFIWNGTEWREERLPNGAVLNLPRAMRRLATMNSLDYNGNNKNHFTVLGLGDSMLRQGAWPHIKSVFENNLDLVGIGFDEVFYEVTSGTITVPTDGNQRRTDLWGTGRCWQLQNGAVVEFGIQVGNDVKPFWSDTASFYFGQESGGGTVDIERSTNGGSSWTSVETGISTDGATGLLLKKYTATANEYLYRVTVTSGNVELIGTFFRAEGYRGFARLSSGLGGTNLLDDWAGTNYTIFQGVLADIDADMIISQYSVEDADSFDDYCDEVEAAAGTADHVYFALHEQEADDDDPKSLNPRIRSKAETIESMHVFDVDRILTWEQSFDLGWTADSVGEDPSWTSDSVHQDPAWAYIAHVFCRNFGYSGGVEGLKWTKNRQEGNIDQFQTTPRPLGKRVILNMLGNVDQDFTLRWGYLDDISNVYFWDAKRLDDTDADYPEGLEIRRSTVAGGSGRVMAFSRTGHVHVINDFYVEGDIIGEGISEYANDAAADADSGLPSGGFYKLTGDRTIYQKP